MKFTVKKNDIRDVLSKVQGLTGRKTNLAITTNVIIEASESGIIIRATDLETGFVGMFPADVDSEGSIALNARKLFEIVRDFPSEAIHINEIENHWIEIGNDNVEYHLVGMNTEEFPEIPKVDDTPFFEIDAESLNNMIERTVYISGASDDKRAHIIGIYLETLDDKKNKTFRLVSTDGSRLAKADHLYDKKVELPSLQGILVPKKGMYELSKFLDDSGSVRIGIKGNYLVVKKESETIIIRLLEGDFPKYHDIIAINKDFHTITMDRQLFLMMLKRMSILSSEDYRSAVFKFNDDKLNITSTNPDIGESKEDMSIEFSGDPIEAAFNPRYFIEALNVITGEKVILSIFNDENPCMLQGHEDQGFLTVVMPMRI
jgi:DNA polymerase-3 subunit beta